MDRPSPQPTIGFAHRVIVAFSLVALVLVAPGCMTSRCDAWRPVDVASPALSAPTESALSKYHGKDAKPNLALLRESFVKDPTRETAFALAETYYAQGDAAERANSEHSIDAFYLACSYAYYHMFAIHDGQQPNPRMWEVYHSALARCLQAGQTRGRLDAHKGLLVAGREGKQLIPIAHNAGPWKADDFDGILVVGDYDAAGLSHRYRREGLGVPIVAIRNRRNDGTARDAFFAPKQPFPVTAVLRPDLDALLGKNSKSPEIELTGGGRKSLEAMNPAEAKIEFIDPLRAATVEVGSMTPPLAADLSASFVACEDCSQTLRFDWLGFREPARLDKLAGLFFLEPYQPGKIPVVFIHGLWSDFHTWDESLNELRQNPIIRERYQFAVYLYPTGSPFALNAMKLRRTLTAMRSLAEPNDKAMDEIVLVGHSMGGILARMQVTASGNTLWENVSTRPIESLKTDEVTRAFLKETFFFEPNPSVKRVIFLGTPQKGSSLGGSCLRRVASSLVVQPGEIQEAVKKLRDDNPGAFLPAFMGGLPTSIDNLATDNPTLRAINKMPFSPHARMHSVVGHGKFLPLFAPGDGVVPTNSARLAAAESELFVNDWHTHVHRDPRSTREIERILGEHLEDVDRRGK